MNMKFEIINIEEFSGRKAQIYSVMYEGDDMTLMDHFFEDNGKDHQEGCREHFFKLNEGALGDGVVALSYNRMRLYCLRYDNTCIFIGSGGYKPPNIRAYQEDPFLNSKAQEMKRIATCINTAIQEKDLKVKDDGTLDISEFIELEI